MSIDWKDKEEKRAYDRAYQSQRRETAPEANRQACARYRAKHPRPPMDPEVKRRHYSEAAKNRWAARAAATRMLTEADRKRLGDRVKVSEFIDTQKQAPCKDCGGSFPSWVMDFDHRDPKTKRRSVSKCRKMAEAVAEIGKCDLVCANCHRQREHERREFFKCCRALQSPALFQ